MKPHHSAEPGCDRGDDRRGNVYDVHAAFSCVFHDEKRGSQMQDWSFFVFRVFFIFPFDAMPAPNAVLATGTGIRTYYVNGLLRGNI